MGNPLDQEDHNGGPLEELQSGDPLSSSLSHMEGCNQEDDASNLTTDQYLDVQHMNTSEAE